MDTQVVLHAVWRILGKIFIIIYDQLGKESKTRSLILTLVLKIVARREKLQSTAKGNQKKTLQSTITRTESHAFHNVL